MSAQTASKAEAVEAAKPLFCWTGDAETRRAELVGASGMNRYAIHSLVGSKR